jgi:hypothetical protein
MNKPSEILVERFIRASLNLVPLGIGGIIDQLFYGIKESMDSEQLKSDIESIKGMIIDLYNEKISNDQLVDFIKATDQFRNIILRIDTLEKNKLSIVRQVSSLNLFKIQFQQKIKQNEIVQENLQKTIENLNNNYEKLFDEFNELTNELNSFVKSSNEQSDKTKFFNLKSIKYDLLEINRTIFELKESLKLSYKKNIKFILSDFDISSYIGFPLSYQSIDIAYLCYHLNANTYPIKILTIDYDSIIKIIRRYQYDKNITEYIKSNYDKEVLSPEYVRERIKFVLSKINRNNEIEYDIDKNIDKNLYSIIIAKLNTRKTITVLKTIIKFTNFLEKNDKELIFALNSKLEKKIVELIKEYKDIQINNEDINLYSSKIIALASFFKSVKFKGDIVTSCSIIQKILRVTIEDLNFEISERDSVELLKELKVINSSILSFKNDFEVKVLNPLKSLEKKQKIFNESFIEFYNAYIPLEEILQESLL